jgi:hypothetical protein
MPRSTIPPGLKPASIATRKGPFENRASSAEDDPEARAFIADYLRKHYTQWIDSPLPALDGRTPREAAESAYGREQVEALLQGMGKHEIDLPPS